MVGKGFTAIGLSKYYRMLSLSRSQPQIAIQLDVYDDVVTAYDGGVITGATYVAPGEHAGRDHRYEHCPARS